jgi:hypothetical protein
VALTHVKGLSTTLVLCALAALAAAASFLLAAEAARKPVVEPDPGSGFGLRTCGYVPGTTCGPVPAPEWSTTGAQVCVTVAGVLLVAAAGMWLRSRVAWRPVGLR